MPSWMRWGEEMKFTDATILSNRIEELVDSGRNAFYNTGDGLIIPHSDPGAFLDEYEMFIKEADLSAADQETYLLYLETFKMMRQCWGRPK